MSCPICHKPAAASYRPFCSSRCADVDLARWLREDYTIPAPLTEAEDDDPSGQDHPAPETR